jgi:hypothetical protein
VHGNGDWPVLPERPPDDDAARVRGAARGVLAEVDAILGRCSDPPPASCADAACPAHGDPGIAYWARCGTCGDLVHPDAELCAGCGAPR